MTETEACVNIGGSSDISVDVYLSQRQTVDSLKYQEERDIISNPRAGRFVGGKLEVAGGDLVAGDDDSIGRKAAHVAPECRRKVID